MAPTTYGEILARNIRAARSRADLGQDSVAARMRALGYDAWIRQTVSSTERGRRRPTAEEILALALVLDTPLQRLMVPDGGEDVAFTTGKVADWRSVRLVVMDMNRPSAMAIVWHDDDDPEFPEFRGWDKSRLPESDG